MIGNYERRLCKAMKTRKKKKRLEPLLSWGCQQEPALGNQVMLMILMDVGGVLMDKMPWTRGPGWLKDEASIAQIVEENEWLQ